MYEVLWSLCVCLCVVEHFMVRPAEVCLLGLVCEPAVCMLVCVSVMCVPSLCLCADSHAIDMAILRKKAISH